MKSEIKTKDAKKGGYLVGKPHSEGGIKGINVDTGEPIEVEGGEVVITKPAVQSKEVYMFEGKEMTPKEILSKLNSDHGGVAFEKGGEVGEELYAKGGRTENINSMMEEAFPKDKMLQLLKKTKFKTFDSSKIENLDYISESYNPFDKHFTLQIDAYPCVIKIHKKQDVYEVSIGKDMGLIYGFTFGNWDYVFEMPSLNFNEFQKGLQKAISDKNIVLYSTWNSSGVKDFYFKGSMAEAKRFAKRNGYEERGSGEDIYFYNPSMSTYRDEKILKVGTFTDRQIEHGGVQSKGGIKELERNTLAHGGFVEQELYARGGGTRTKRTAAPSFEAEIEAVKKEDKAEKLKYQTLEEIIEQDITKWSVLQGMAGKGNSFRKNEIDRKLADLREKRDLYALKQQTSSELLQSLAKVFTKEKITQGTINPELLTPNGQPTMLTEDQYFKVRSQEFLDWYGDWVFAYDLENYGGVSKTINDATKEPLVLYHGSRHDFARWRFEKFPAAYFADNISYAQWFANFYGDGNLYQVFVDMKNPIDVRSFGVDEYPIRNYLEFIEENYLITPEQADARVAQFGKTNPENTEQYLDHPCRFWEYIRHINTGLLTYLRDNTFMDGILMFENNPSDVVDGKENVTGSYVVFRTEQIKWASANHFNLLVKDARFDKGGITDR